MTALTTRCALRAKPYPCQFFGGLHGVLLMVRDVGGLIEGYFTVNWAGIDALDFTTVHAAELVAGRCVYLTINRIHLFQRDIRGDVLSCSLAPLAPSWVDKPAATRPDGVYSSDFRQ